MKRCALILPYFGKFNNYFQLFLNSCANAKYFDWFIFSDSENGYKVPSNVRWIDFSLEDFNKLASTKIGITVDIKKAYKLCDYKPTYGLVFEDYLNGYDYWGHCDCDVIFGDLDKIVAPLLNEGYDKLFAAGHLTIYKNTPDIARFFMREIAGKKVYREYLCSNSICWFDEDMYKHENIHGIFLESGSKLYTVDLSMNTCVESGKFIRTYYDSASRKFIDEKYKKALYFWNAGELFRISCDNKSGELIKEEYAYMHFQSRRMRVKKMDKYDNSCIKICPDRFVFIKDFQNNINRLNLAFSGFSYMYLGDKIRRRVKRKLCNILNWRR